jgi:vancomycin resistance protein VanJ
MMRLIVLSAGWLGGCTILAGLSLRLFSGDELRVARYTGYVMPWLLVGIVPGAIWAWRAHARALFAVLAVCAAMIAIAHVPLLGRRDAVRPPSALTLSVMSYNTWSRNHDEQGIARVVLEAAPDLVLLQEIPPPVFGRVMDRLAGLYGGAPVHAAYEPALQQAAVSRYPLGASTAMKGKGEAQRVILGTPAGPVTVFNVHSRRERGWRHRYDRLAALLGEDVLPQTAPVILAGDLNAPEHSEPYALVAAHLENAHRAAGSGFGFTYPASAVRLLGTVPAFPVVRIDHVFFSRHFVALRAETLEDSGGSDHRPVLAVLALAPSGESVRR